MEAETKIHSTGSVSATCQNCKNEFIIESEDFSFYEKIKVPPPTFCPECRKIRRMVWRNERKLYHRNCDLCEENVISIYDPSKFIVYCRKCFYGDDWDPLSFGLDLNFSEPFLKQLNRLIGKAPKLATQKSNDIVNSEYTNHVGNLKNCYLLFASVNNEDSMYSTHINYSKNLIDGYRLSKSELCYECVDCSNSYNLKFSTQSQNCIDSWFLFNCRNCSHCFLCSNLVSKSYCIKNIQYSKEEYQNYIEELKTGNSKKITKLLNDFDSLKIETIRKFNEGVNNIYSTGSYVNNTKNCKECFDTSNTEDCKFLGYADKAKDVMDGYAVYPGSELSYEVVGSGVRAYGNLFSYLPWEDALGLCYCVNAFPACQNCFGCVQVRSKKYCILNKQYTKEEYESLVPKIIKHMNDMPYIDSKGRVYKYGEFFPSELSPFCYNETIAQEYFLLTKEEALDQGYKWKDKEPRNYQIEIKNEDIPDDIKDIDESIIGKVIECKGNEQTQCTEAFKIIEPEYQFYKRMNLPLPRFCPNCRHYNRLKQRNPLKLWHRKCMKDGCTNEFETSYAPERPEIVYCEQCYQGEVY